MSEHQLEEHQLKEQLRIKAYRLKQSMKPTSSTASTTDMGTPYRSRQALGKAMKRLEQAFYHLHVSNILLLENLLDLSDYRFHHHLRKASLQKVKLKRELVHTFYRTDDVSWQALGKKDCIIIREATEAGERIKQTQQVCYMIRSRATFNSQDVSFEILRAAAT